MQSMAEEILEKRIHTLEHQVEDLYNQLVALANRYQDSIVATQMKVGIDQSKDANSLDFRISALEQEVFHINRSVRDLSSGE